MGARVGRVGVVLVVLVALAACGDDGGGGGDAKGPDSGSTTVSSTTSTTLASSTTTTAPFSIVTVPLAVASAGDTLPDGTVFGYITTLIAGHEDIYGQFDLAELLTGDEAVAAAHAAGGEAENDYFIRNDSKRLREIHVDPTVVVQDVDYGGDCCDLRPVDIAQWAADRDDAHEGPTPVYLTTENGVVTGIREQFFP